MRRIVKYILLPVSTFSFFSCERDIENQHGINENSESGNVRTVIFEARFAEDITKTSYQGGGKVDWVEGDTIRYYTKENSAIGEYEVVRSGHSTKVLADIPVGTSYIIATYGGTGITSRGESYFTLNGAVKGIQSGKFEDAHVSVAKTYDIQDGSCLTFHNMTSLIKFSLERADVSYVIFKANGGEKIRGEGELQISFADDNPTASFGIFRGSEIRVNTNGAGEFYISILPTLLSKGFTISLYNKDGAFLGNVTDDSTIFIGGNSIYNLGLIDSHVIIEHTDLSAEGTSNCYVVSTYGNYKFKATVKGSTTEALDGTPSSAETLWESFGTDVTPNVGDVVKDISYSDGYIKFSTPQTLNDGNAVIAVKDASGNILWSWHIWVCKGFAPNTSAQVYKNNAGTMMDRNLGATSATPGDVHALGVLYQWGRKDPFLSGNSIASTISWPGTVSSNASTGTIAYAIAHPTTFITYNSVNYDWYYTGSPSTDYTRWQTSDRDKGMYDPCPVGWRVPDGGLSGVWSTAFGSSLYYDNGPWDNINKGMNFGSDNGKSSSMQLGRASTIWYPAAGCRRDDDGVNYFVRYSGNYWSCSPTIRTAYDLYLWGYGNVNQSSSSNGRANGQSVRCIKEGTAPRQEPKYVDLGLSVKWAKCNIGADSPEQYGRYFAWGDVTGQTWNGSKWSGGGFSTYPAYGVNENNNLKSAYDAAQVVLGGTWRMPTYAEQQELIDNCTSTWTSDYNGTGVAGRIFTSNKEGYTDKSIFLPAAGYGYSSYLYNAGSGGRYWSSTFFYDDARDLGFTSDNVCASSNRRYYGLSVRPVTE